MTFNPWSYEVRPPTPVVAAEGLGMARAAERDLILELLVGPRHLPHIPAIARRHPEMRININHLAKPAVPDGTLDEWKRGMAAIAECPNVVFKVSALIEMWGAFHDGWTAEDAVAPQL